MKPPHQHGMGFLMGMPGFNQLETYNTNRFPRLPEKVTGRAIPHDGMPFAKSYPPREDSSIDKQHVPRPPPRKNHNGSHAGKENGFDTFLISLNDYMYHIESSGLDDSWHVVSSSLAALKLNRQYFPTIIQTVESILRGATNDITSVLTAFDLVVTFIIKAIPDLKSTLTAIQVALQTILFKPQHSGDDLISLISCWESRRRAYRDIETESLKKRDRMSDSFTQSTANVYTRRRDAADVSSAIASACKKWSAYYLRASFLHWKLIASSQKSFVMARQRSGNLRKELNTALERLAGAEVNAEARWKNIWKVEQVQAEMNLLQEELRTQRNESSTERENWNIERERLSNTVESQKETIDDLENTVQHSVTTLKGLSINTASLPQHIAALQDEIFGAVEERDKPLPTSPTSPMSPILSPQHLSLENSMVVSTSPCVCESLFKKFSNSRVSKHLATFDFGSPGSRQTSPAVVSIGQTVTEQDSILHMLQAAFPDSNCSTVCEYIKLLPGKSFPLADDGERFNMAMSFHECRCIIILMLAQRIMLWEGGMPRQKTECSENIPQKIERFTLEDQQVRKAVALIISDYTSHLTSEKASLEMSQIAQNDNIARTDPLISLVTTLTRDLPESSTCTNILFKFKERLVNVYRYYASSDRLMDTVMSKHELERFFKDLKLDVGSNRRKSSQTVQQNNSIPRWGSSSKQLSDGLAKDSISPECFIEALVRVSNSRSQSQPLSVKLQNLIDGFVLPNLMYTNFTEFSHSVQSENTQNVLRLYQSQLLFIFNKYAVEKSKFMCFKEFKKLMDDMHAIDEVFTHYALQQIFLKLRKTQLTTSEVVIDFISFRTDICAVAAYKNPAPFLPLHLKVKQFIQTWLIHDRRASCVSPLDLKRDSNSRRDSVSAKRKLSSSEHA